MWRSVARCASVGSRQPAMRSQWPGGAWAHVAYSAWGRVQIEWRRTAPGQSETGY